MGGREDCEPKLQIENRNGCSQRSVLEINSKTFREDIRADVEGGSQVEGFERMKRQKKILKEELTNKDLDDIRLLIRYEVAQIMFDLYKKRKVWE